MDPQPARLEPSLNRGLTVRRIVKALSRPLWAVRNGRYHWIRTISEADHVFVVGPPRSGTTLMQSLLRAHPVLCGLDGEETRFFFRRNYLDLHYPEIADDKMQQILRESRDAVDLFDHMAAVLVEQGGGSRFIEKTPEHALRLPFLIRHFPRAKFVFMLRDPRDGYLSARRNPKVKIDNIPMYTELWKRSVEAYEKARDAGAAIHLVSYEGLCRDPQTELASVMAFLGEALDERQLEPDSYSKTRVKREMGHQRLGERITDASVGQWTERLNTNELQEFKQRIGLVIERMGYPAEGAKGG